MQRLNLHGLHFQHVALCPRRAWMYLHRINFAQWHQRVAAGAALHATSYARDRSVRGLFGLAPDRIDWQQRVVYENKGSGGAGQAVNDQAAFYALMLSIADGQTWTARVHVLPQRRGREVALDDAQLERLWASSLRLEALAEQSAVPEARRIGLCASCSVAALCGYD